MAAILFVLHLPLPPSVEAEAVTDAFVGLIQSPPGASRKPPLDFNRFWDGLLAPDLDAVPRTAPIVLTHIQP